jgi:hypothetical protein
VAHGSDEALAMRRFVPLVPLVLVLARRASAAGSGGSPSLTLVAVDSEPKGV